MRRLRRILKGGNVTIQELRAKVRLGLKICERLEESAVIPASVLKRRLQSIKNILQQMRLNLLQSDIFVNDLRSLQDIETIVLGVWPELEMLIAWNNGSLFDRIDNELVALSACPFCGAEVEIGDWRSASIDDSGHLVVDYPCQCLTGGSSFHPNQERFGLFRVNDRVLFGGLFACDVKKPVIAVVALYDHSLNDETKTAYGWRFAIEIKPENYVPSNNELVWQQIFILPSVEAVRLAKLIREIEWTDFAGLYHDLFEGRLDDDIPGLSKELLALRKYLNSLK